MPSERSATRWSTWARSSSRSKPKPLVITSSLTLDLGPFYRPINQGLLSLLGPNTTTLQSLQGLLAPLAGGAAVIVRGAISGVVWAIFILVFSFYMVKDAPHFGRFVAINVPEPLRPEVGRLWHEIVRIWNSFVRGQFVVAVVMGFTVMVTMGALGVRNTAVLGLISGIMEFVPAIGPGYRGRARRHRSRYFLGSSWLPIPNLWFALVVGLTYFLLQQFENLYLVPRAWAPRPPASGGGDRRRAGRPPTRRHSGCPVGRTDHRISACSARLCLWQTIRH